MSTVAQKLGIKADAVVSIDGHPVDEVRHLLGELPDGVTLQARSGDAVDQVLLVADGLTELAPMLDGAWSEVAPNGRLWVWYRKGASRSPGAATPLHRDTLQALLAANGLDGVTLISVDETWSSMRVKSV